MEKKMTTSASFKNDEEKTAELTNPKTLETTETKVMLRKNSTNNDTPSHILTSDPKSLLDAVDMFIGKGGPGSIGENAIDNTSDGTTKANGKESEVDEFSAISFLNHHFSTESLLITHLPTLQSTIQEQISSLSSSISSCIHAQSQNYVQTAEDVKQAKTAIMNLNSRITLVQRKAKMSERAVLEITRDIKRLDYAKRHLQKTITALKRLHMLIHAVDQLKLAAKQMRYSEAANLVDAVRELLKHFQGYQSSIAKMREIRDKVHRIRRDLREQIFDGFRVAGGIHFHPKHKQRPNKQSQNQPQQLTQDANINPNPAGDSEQAPIKQNKSILLPHSALAEACQVVDALGLDVRTNFIETFCNDHLQKYPKMFSPTLPSSSSQQATNPKSFKKNPPPAYMDNINDHENDNVVKSSLDQVDSRFAWFRALIRSIDDKFEDVFPVYWQIHYHVTVTFLKMTRSHFFVLLDGPNKDKDSKDVTVLLKALQKTILFEKEMTAWLIRDYQTIFANPNDLQQNSMMNDQQQPIGEDGEILEFDENGNAVVATSAQGIRIKYARQKKEKSNVKNKQTAKSGTDPNIPVVHTEDPMDEIPYKNYYKSKTNQPMKPLLTQASSAFDKFMSPYIDLEKENMNEQLAEAVNDGTVDTRGELPVFTSSTNLFIYIKKSIERCTALTRGTTFFLLYKAFDEALKKYSNVLSQKLPQPNLASNLGGISIASLSSNSSSATSSASYKIPPGEELTVCHVIDTCEYCADTVEALEDLIKDKMDDEFKERIDLSSSQGSFYDVTAKGLRVLVSGLENRVEIIMKEMYSINWGTIDVVGEESVYVTSLHESIQPFVLGVQKVLPSSYYRTFCDKFAVAFANLYYNTVLRLKRISESGTQQLLLDVYNMKTLLLKLPVMSSKAETSSSGGISSTATNAIPPAMYTNMVTKEINRVEILLKLIATPPELLPDMFKSTWPDGTASDFQSVMVLKGMKRTEQQSYLEKVGLDKNTGSGVGAVVGASATNVSNAVTELWKGKGTDVADKVNSDLNQMRQKVDDFRKQFR